MKFYQNNSILIRQIKSHILNKSLKILSINDFTEVSDICCFWEDKSQLIEWNELQNIDDEVTVQLFDEKFMPLSSNTKYGHYISMQMIFMPISDINHPHTDMYDKQEIQDQFPIHIDSSVNNDGFIEDNTAESFRINFPQGFTRIFAAESKPRDLISSADLSTHVWKVGVKNIFSSRKVPTLKPTKKQSRLFLLYNVCPKKEN